MDPRQPRRLRPQAACPAATRRRSRTHLDECRTCTAIYLELDEVNSSPRRAPGTAAPRRGRRRLHHRHRRRRGGDDRRARPRSTAPRTSSWPTARHSPPWAPPAGVAGVATVAVVPAGSGEPHPDGPPPGPVQRSAPGDPTNAPAAPCPAGHTQAPAADPPRHLLRRGRAADGMLEPLAEPGPDQPAPHKRPRTSRPGPDPSRPRAGRAAAGPAPQSADRRRPADLVSLRVGHSAGERRPPVPNRHRHDRAARWPPTAQLPRRPRDAGAAQRRRAASPRLGSSPSGRPGGRPGSREDGADDGGRSPFWLETDPAPEQPALHFFKNLSSWAAR